MAKRTRVSVVNNCSSAVELQTLKINSRRWSMSMLNLSTFFLFEYKLK